MTSAVSLPAALARRLDRDDDDGFTLQLLTVTRDGRPHLALLSVGEVVNSSGGSVRIALWSGSSAAKNLAGGSAATLAAVVDGALLALSLEPTPCGSLDIEGQELAAFECPVVSCRRSVAPYADLKDGVTFRLHDRAAATARWAATRHALRSLPAPGDAGQGDSTDIY